MNALFGYITTGGRVKWAVTETNVWSYRKMDASPFPLRARRDIWLEAAKQKDFERPAWSAGVGRVTRSVAVLQKQP